MIAFARWTVALALASNLNSSDQNDQQIALRLATLRKDAAVPISATTLTITRVKRPWYAWRSLVVGKMKKSIPEYQAVAGLQHKLYSLTDDRAFAGGIYLWKSSQAARSWFNQAWFDRTEKQYGQAGTVTYYQVIDGRLAKPTRSGANNYWGVLTYAAQHPFASDQGDNEAVLLMTLKDEEDKTCYLSVWSSEQSAENFFAGKPVKNHYFDVPIWLDNGSPAPQK